MPHIERNRIFPTMHNYELPIDAISGISALFLGLVQEATSTQQVAAGPERAGRLGEKENISTEEFRARHLHKH